MVLFRGSMLCISNTSSKFILNQIYPCPSICLCGTSSLVCLGLNLYFMPLGRSLFILMVPDLSYDPWACQWMFCFLWLASWLCEGYEEVLEGAAVHARLCSRTTKLQHLSVTRSSECPGLCWETHLCLMLIRQLSGFPSLSPSSIALLQRHLAPKSSFVKESSNCCLSGRFLNASRQLFAHSLWVWMWTCLSMGEERLPSSK